MELYITRHGQTKANVEKYMQAQTPGELTTEGCEQAKKFGQYYKNMKFDEIYCSDILRAKKTLEFILDENIQKEDNTKLITYTEKLREINCQSLINKPCSLEIELRSNPAPRFRFNLTGEGDETFIDVFYRISQFLDELIQKNISKDYNSGITKENVYKLNEDAKIISIDNFNSLWKDGKLTDNNDNSKNNIEFKKILIVCHGGAISELFNNFLFRMSNNVIIKRIKTSNTGLSIIRIYPKKRNGKIVSNKDIIFSFKLVDDTTHLNNDK